MDVWNVKYDKMFLLVTIDSNFQHILFKVTRLASLEASSQNIKHGLSNFDSELLRNNDDIKSSITKYYN